MAAARHVADGDASEVAVVTLDGPRKWRRVDWVDVVAFGRLFASSVMFVLRDERDDSPDAFSRAERMSLLGDGVWRYGRRWPGTEIFDGRARIVSVNLVEELTAWLVKEAPTPYGWLDPDWPEDVAFLREDGSVLFESVAHERMSGLCLTPHELIVLESAYGRLRSRFRRRSGAHG